MMKPRGRTIAIVCGVGAACVFVVAASRWSQIQVWYYLLLIGEDPDRVLEFLPEPQESPKGQAVDRFLDGEPGGRPVLELFSEHNTVIVGRVTAVNIRPSGARPRFDNWAVTVTVDDVLRGSPIESGGVTFYVHSPSRDLGLDVDDLPSDEMVWLLNVSGTSIEGFCSRMDPRYDPKAVETFRRIAGKLKK